MAADGQVCVARLASRSLFDCAFEWLCQRRRDYPSDADIWTFRRRWPEEKERLRADLLLGRFRFGLLRRITLKDGSQIDLWPPRDVLLSKCLTWVLGQRLGLSKRCTHLKGHGGAKAAVKPVQEHLGEPVRVENRRTTPPSITSLCSNGWSGSSRRCSRPTWSTAH